MEKTSVISNYIGGKWGRASAEVSWEVTNPATGERLGSTPEAGRSEVAAAVEAAAGAFPSWRATPAEDRIQFLFRLKQSLEEHFDEIARLITMENGKTLVESRGELRRAVENVEVACGIPTLMQGISLEDVTRGIDEIMFRQPLGVVAAFTPFNFPVFIPFWFLPYAVACGNTFILKPSEKTPLSIQRVFELIEQIGFPPGVLNLVHGGKPTVDALIEHPAVRAISFVGTSAVAKYIYAKTAVEGKRAQCMGSAKNHVVVLPDAEIDSAAQILADSAFGCAGQRCLAVSIALVVGQAREKFPKAISELAGSLRVGSGLDDGTQMGPVITPESKERVERLIGHGVSEGAKPLLDGRGEAVRGYERGNFLAPTILDFVSSGSELMDTEIFGPVLSLVPARDIDEALAILSRSAYGNQASIFTTSGSAARKFRNEVPAGNVGINIGVAAPMAYFPFSGWKGSFFGVLHSQSRDAVEFYTEKKIVIERWPKEWSRKF